MGKAIFGVLLLILFLWFVRRAFVFFRGRRAIDNAKARLERAEDLHQIRDIEERAEEIEGKFDVRVNKP